MRAGPDASPDAVVEPPFQVLPDAHVLVVEDEPAVTIGNGLGELLANVLTALAVNVAGYPARSSLKCRRSERALLRGTL